MGKDGQRWATTGNDGVAAQRQRRFSAKDVDPPILISFRRAGRAVALRSGQSDSAVWLALLPVLTHYDGVRRYNTVLY